MDKDALKPIVEALIFSSDHPLSFERLVGVLEGESREDIRGALKGLVEDYARSERGIYIEEVAGGYQFRTRPDHAPWIRRLFKIGIQKISRAAIETLAIVAYKQPLTRAELEEIRGVDSAGVLKTLLDKRLVKIVGRKDAPGRPVVYGTTKEFLEAFNLKDLSSLPTLREIEALEEDMVAGEDIVKVEEDTGEDTAAEGDQGEAAEDNSPRGDSLTPQGGGDDPGGEGSAEPQGGR